MANCYGEQGNANFMKSVAIIGAGITGLTAVFDAAAVSDSLALP
jgi:predicted NAD/FAD-binding protein